MADARLEVGATIPPARRVWDQASVLRYAAASGDFNPLHWDAGTAARVSPTGGVIVHGMATFGFLTGVVASWAGGADRVLEVHGAFRAPCPVGAEVVVGGEVVEVEPEEGVAVLSVWAETVDGDRIVDRRRSRVRVRLS